MHRIIPCLLALLCLYGCAPQAPSQEESITSLVTTLYTVPDDFHKKNYEQLLAADGPESEGKAISARLNHNKERFNKACFAEGALDYTARCFAENDIYLEPYLLKQGASLTCHSVGFYGAAEPGDKPFAANVVLTGKDGKETTYTIYGAARFDKYDQFDFVEITDDSGLGKALGAAHWPRDNFIDTHGGPTPGPSVTPEP